MKVHNRRKATLQQAHQFGHHQSPELLRQHTFPALLERPSSMKQQAPASQRELR